MGHPAVLHFARDDAHFASMLRGCWRVLKPGGLFVSRLASTVGLENQIQPLQGRRYKLPDGSERYLVDEALLASFTERMGELADPLKTTLVHNLRAMTTLGGSQGRAVEPLIAACLVATSCHGCGCECGGDQGCVTR